MSPAPAVDPLSYLSKNTFLTPLGIEKNKKRKTATPGIPTAFCVAQASKTGGASGSRVGAAGSWGGRLISVLVL